MSGPADVAEQRRVHAKVAAMLHAMLREAGPGAGEDPESPGTINRMARIARGALELLEPTT